MSRDNCGCPRTGPRPKSTTGHLLTCRIQVAADQEMARANRESAKLPPVCTCTGQPPRGVTTVSGHARSCLIERAAAS